MTGTDPEPRRALRIGITGPIGCGKSQVARWLADLGAAVIDADLVAREVTAPGQPAHDAVLAHFGPSVAAPDGTLDRKALGRLVFGDAARLRELEGILHPAVRARILAALDEADRDGTPAIVVEAIKLFEGGLAELCDETWLIACGPVEQLERLAARGTSPEEASQRIAAQGAMVERLRPRATRVIDTSGVPDAVQADVARCLTGALATRP